MSFFGKKYKRVASENVEELIKFAKLSKEQADLVRSEDAGFTFTRVDDQVLQYNLHHGEKTIPTTFKLNEEFEITKRDGSKARAVYTLENENVLVEVVDWPTGKVEFRRDFQGNRCVLTISPSGTDIKAKIFYEVEEPKNIGLRVKFWKTLIRWKVRRGQHKKGKDGHCTVCGRKLTSEDLKASNRSESGSNKSESGSSRSDLGSNRAELWSTRAELGSLRAESRSSSPELGSERTHTPVVGCSK